MMVRVFLFRKVRRLILRECSVCVSLCRVWLGVRTTTSLLDNGDATHNTHSSKDSN